ncbi:hypothetical protein Cpir12675_006654 [Ceratocystis pirilliformis]|uniref:Uncharacterized protein n=1 Tax=Ceratocystis pirilliformis TaxID=259994 RepID=A0ABR3YH66_9PEZI
MRFSKFMSLCFSLPGLRGCKPRTTDDFKPTPAANVKPVQAVDLEFVQAQDPSDIYYLHDHGYTVWDIDGGGVKVYSERYGLTGQDVVLQLYFDVEHGVTTVYNNNLRRERVHDDNLGLPEVFGALCYYKNVPCGQMTWIHMEIDQKFTLDALEDFRMNSLLSPTSEIRVIPGDLAWDTFSNNHYFQDASQMMPGSKIDRVIVRRKERNVGGSCNPPEATETIMFSFKERLSNFGNSPSDFSGIDAMDNLDAALRAADGFYEADSEAFPESDTDTCFGDEGNHPKNTPEHPPFRSSPKSSPDST